MAVRKHANNKHTTLAGGGLTNVATSMTVTSAAGWPAIAAGETFRVTLQTGSTYEIIEVTDDASTPTFTVVRGREGTSAIAWAAGSLVSLRATADSFDRKQDQVASALDVIDFGDASSFEIPNSAAPTVNATGEIALDTTITDHKGLIKYYDGTGEMVVIACPTANLTTTDNYGLTYDAATDSFDFSSLGGGSNSFETIAVSGQANVVADSSTDTLTLVAGTNISITTNAGSDSITITNSAPSGGGGLDAYTTTALAGGTTTLTVSSNYQQFFTGSGATGQVVTMPVTTTLVVGQSWLLVNLSTGTGVLTVRSSGANTIIAVPAKCYAVVTCTTASGTTATSWDYWTSPTGNSVTGTGDIVRATSPTFVTALLGTPTSGTLTNCTGLPVAGGGTGLASATAWCLLTGGTTSTGAFQSVPIGTAGQFLMSQGASSLPIYKNASEQCSEVTGTSQAAAVNTTYIANNGSQVVVTLPASAAIGDYIEIIGKGAGGWKMTANTGQTIKVANTTTTSAGSIASANTNDCIRVKCITNNTTWVEVCKETTGFTVT